MSGAAVWCCAAVNVPGSSYSVDAAGNPSSTTCPINTYGPGLKKQRACVPCPTGFITDPSKVDVLRTSPTQCCKFQMNPCCCKLASGTSSAAFWSVFKTLRLLLILSTLAHSLLASCAWCRAQHASAHHAQVLTASARQCPRPVCHAMTATCSCQLCFVLHAAVVSVQWCLPVST
jgi:hypothetical protein